MAAPASINLFRDTLDLLRLYNSSSAFKASFERLLDNPRATYLGRPLKDYVYVMTKVTPQYKGIFQQGLTKEHIGDLLNDFYYNKYGYNVLNKECLDLQKGVTEQPGFLTKEEHQEVVKQEEAKEKAKKINKVGAATSIGSAAASGMASGTGSGTAATNKKVSVVSGQNSGVGSGTAATNKKQVPGLAILKADLTNKISFPPPAAITKTVRQRAREESAKLTSHLSPKIPLVTKPLIVKVPYPVKNAFQNAASRGKIIVENAWKRSPQQFRGTAVGSVTGYSIGLLVSNGNPTIAGVLGLVGGTVGNVLGGNETRPEVSLPYNPVAKRLEQNTKSLAANMGRRAGGTLVRNATAILVRNPYFWAVIGILILIILFFFFLLNSSALFPPWQKEELNYCPSASVGGSCPTQEEIDANRADRATCRGLNPAINIFDTTFTEEQVNTYVEKYNTQSKLGIQEFTRRTRYIVSEAQTVGLNPVIFLGLWKTESGFSSVTTASDLGCAPGYDSQRGFERQVQCAMGISSGGSSTARCATSKDPESQACRNETGRLNTYPQIYGPYGIKIPIATFDDFAGMYGPFSPILGDAAQNNNCIHSYNTMLEVASAVNACKAGTSLAGSSGLSGKVVVLDPGHTNPDKFGEGKADENELNLRITEKLKTLLSSKGYSVILTRSGEGGSSYYQDLQDRIDVTNQAKAAAFISVHFDHNTPSKAGELTAYYRRNDQLSQKLGQAVSSGIAKQLNGFSSNNPEPGDYYVLNPTGADTDCSSDGKVKGYGGVTCNPAKESKVQRGLEVPGIIQEIFPGNVPYSSLNDKVEAIALGYCNGVSQFLGDGDCSTKALAQATTPATSNNVSGPTANNAATIPTSGSVTLSCPLAGDQGSNTNTITCGTATNPTASCGHGGRGYDPCDPSIYKECPYTPQLKAAVDIVPGKGANAPVYAPFVYGNQAVTWTKSKEPEAINGGNWGYKLILTAQFQGKALQLDLTHISRQLNFDSTVNSGQQVGSVYPNTNGDGIGHLHAALSVDGKWQDSMSETQLCTKDAPPPPPGTGGAVPGGTNSCPVVNTQPSSTDTAAQGDFFCQWDPKWGGQTNGGSCSLANGGCGPTSIAMLLRRTGNVAIPTSDKWGSFTVLADLKGQPVNPPNIDRIFISQGWRFCGSAMSNVFEWLKTIGYKVEDVGLKDGLLDLDSAQNFLSTGHLIIGSQDKYISPNTGGVISHIFGISGIDKANNQVRAFDPNNCNQDGTEGPQVYIPNLADRSWLYAKAIKR